MAMIYIADELSDARGALVARLGERGHEVNVVGGSVVGVGGGRVREATGEG